MTTLDYAAVKQLKKIPFSTTQNERLYNAFITGISITQETARTKYNIKRLAARVYDLKADLLCVIESKPVVENKTSPWQVIKCLGVGANGSN